MSKYKMFWVGIAFGISYLIIDPFVMSFVLNKGPFLKILLLPSIDDIWMRSFNMLLCTTFGLYAHILFAKSKKAENTLRQFKHIVNSSTDMMALLDKKFVHIAANKAYLNRFNKNYDELIGHSILEIFGEEFFSSVIKPNIERCLAGDVVEYQSWLEFPESKSAYMNIHYYPYKDNNNKVVGFVVNGRDITEHMQMEKALKESEQDLQDLIYIASHDLQSPILSMVGFTNQLLKEYSMKLDEQGIFNLTRLKVNAQRLHKLILSLLDISRINTEKNPQQVFNPKQELNNILEELELTIKETGTKIEIEELPQLKGDRPRLKTVFRNLISNAIHYGAKNITIGYSVGSYFVRDDGIGVPKSQLEKIFNPGQRLKQVEIEGVGMGLTICKKIMDKHSGRIWAESEGKGKGSTFYFSLNT